MENKMFHLKSLQKVVQNIKETNFDTNVINNMMLACGFHDAEYHTRHCNILELWLRRHGYKYE